MRWAIVSDIHANLQAFEAVLNDIAAQKVDRTICLGDAVGYGPQPAEVLTLLHAHVHHMLMGNHEAAVAGLMDLSRFNPDAKGMVEWTRKRLNRAGIGFMAALPHEHAGPGFACVHGSFTDPAAFPYVENEDDALRAFGVRPEPLLFVGHTHEPAVFVLAPDGVCARYAPEPFALEAGCRYIVNTGSVGMPRGQDFRASYCTLDTDLGQVAFHRVVYDTALFRRQVERCSGDSRQVAYVLGLVESHALPKLNSPVDFAAPSARPAARIVVRKPAADSAPPAPATRPQAAAKPTRSRKPLVVTLAVLGMAAVAAVVIVAASAHRGRKAGTEAAVAKPAEPTPPAAVVTAPAAPPAVEPAVAAAPVAPPAAPAAAASAAPAGTVWKAVLKDGEAQSFAWAAEGSWNRAGFPDGRGVEAVIDLGRRGITGVDVNLGRDITVGKVRVSEASNATVVWLAGHTMIFDNGAAHAQWIRDRGTSPSGALRLTVLADLRLESTLEAQWSVQRGIELKGRIDGPGGLIIEHRSNDGVVGNRQVWFRGGPNTYAGGTTLRGRGSASRPSIFSLEKNGALGTGDVTVNELAHLVLTDRGAADDMIADRAVLRLASAGGVRTRVVLAEGVEETVGGLAFDGAPQAAGSWGSAGSRAEHKSDEYFEGPGILIVRPPAVGGP